MLETLDYTIRIGSILNITCNLFATQAFKGDVTRDDFQRQFLTQYCSCCTKNRCFAATVAQL